MSSFKSFFGGLYNITSEFIMAVPFHFIRYLYLKPVLKYLGTHTALCRNLDIRSPRRIIIGSHTQINKRTVLDGRGGILKIGDNVDIAQDCKIWTLQHDYNSPTYQAVGKPVTIEDYAWIASGATILPGVTIGKGAVVATGSIVTKDVAPYSIVAGIPAKKIGDRNQTLNYELGVRKWFQ